jgi:hypothetical protein
MSIRIYFLLGIGGAAFNLPFWKVLVLIAGYAICDSIDEFLLKKRMRKRLIDAVDHEIGGWETEQDDPTSESKGDWSRVKLTQENQILFHRVTDVMRSVILAATK